jgi:hypothetical protein
MPEPTTVHAADDVIDAFPEPPMTSAVIDDDEVSAASDQWPTPDLSDLDPKGLSL